MQSYRLKNGLKILVKEDHRTAAVVLQLWYKVGGSYEPQGQTGISHALEHMMFRGTPRFPGNAYSQMITAQGGRDNAQTSRDHTIYYAEFVPSVLSLALELEADRMSHLTLSPKDFTKEKKIILEERRLRVDDDPFALMYEQFSAHAFSNNYRNPVIGTVRDIQNLTVQKLKNWYDLWYVPNNAILVVAGDVYSKEVHHLAKKYFAEIPSRNIPSALTQSPKFSLGDPEVRIKLSAKLGWILMGYRVPSIVTAKPKWHAYALAVIAAILSKGHSSRFYRQLVSDQQIAVEADASYDLYERFNGMFLMTAVPEKKVTSSQLKAALLEQIQQLQAKSVSEKELNRVKNQVMARQIYKKDSMFGEANELGLLESIGLSWKAADRHVSQIQALTPSHIQEVAERYFQPSQLTIGTLVPR